MTAPDPAAIARGLTRAQREAILRMKVREPHSFMPNYHAVEFHSGSCGAVEVEAMQRMGLVTLPIATGGRSNPTYHGEIHALGLAVRAHLENSHD